MRALQKARRALFVLGTLLASGSAIVALQPLWAFDVLARLTPGVIWRVDTREPLVALSFDDGPAPAHTPRVLEILARHRARATFFLIGDRAAAYPELVARIRSEGHEIGNHSYDIRSVLHASEETFLAKLTSTEKVLGMSGSAKLFRPPGGKIRLSQVRSAEARGYRVILGSAYPYDGAHPPASYIRWLVTKNLAPGVIVILHDGIKDPSRMLLALDSILEAGGSKGLRFVTVGNLLSGEKTEDHRSVQR